MTMQIRGTTQIMDGTIPDAKIAAAAGIQTSKLAEGADFIKRTGTVPFTADQPHGASDTVSASNFRITKLADPVNQQDAATRGWVLVNATGITPSGHTARAATTANITLSGTQTVDGVALSAGDRCLVKNNTLGQNNGIYVVAAGGWARASDFDTWPEIPGAFVSVQEGTVNGDTIWLSTADASGSITVTPITFTQIPGPSDIQAGAGLTRTGQVIDFVTGDASLLVAADNVRVNPAVALLKTDYVVRETPTGTINGSNTIFNLANTPASGNQEMVFLNGILQDPGSGNDYTIAVNVITFLSAPIAGDKIRVTYLKGATTTGP